MNFLILMTNGLIGAVPMVVALMACVAAYAIIRRGRADLVDSPWFWVFAFSTIGLLGMWAISNKYDDRQKRLEARQEARQRIAQEQVGGRIATPAEDSTANLPSEQTSADALAHNVGYPTERHVPLRYLASALFIASLGSAIMVWRYAARSAPPNDVH